MSNAKTTDAPLRRHLRRATLGLAGGLALALSGGLAFADPAKVLIPANPGGGWDGAGRQTMAAKVAAARKARKNLVIIARTDAAASEGIDGAVARARRYLDAGADAIFPEALTTREMFVEFAKRMPGVKLLANMTEFGRTPFFTASEFEVMGYRMVIWPVSSLRVANKAQEKLYAALARDGGTHAMVDQMQTRVELYKTIGLADYEALDASIVATIAPEGMPQRERSA